MGYFQQVWRESADESLTLAFGLTITLKRPSVADATLTGVRVKRFPIERDFTNVGAVQRERLELRINTANITGAAPTIGNIIILDAIEYGITHVNKQTGNYTITAARETIERLGKFRQ